MTSKQNAEFLARLQSQRNNDKTTKNYSGSRYSTTPKQPPIPGSTGGLNIKAKNGGLPPLPGNTPPPGPGFLASTTTTKDG
jgi:hypothetical protein